MNKKALTKHSQNNAGIIETAKAYEVVDKASYEHATTIKEDLKEGKKKIMEFYKPHVDAANKVHKGLTGERKTYTEPIDKALKIIKTKIEAYEVEQAAKVAKISEEHGIDLQVKAPEGVSHREGWEVTVTDFKALVKAVAEEKVPLNAILADLTYIRNQATSLGTSLNYPGIKVKRVRKVT
jgi:hypothetical protein